MHLRRCHGVVWRLGGNYCIHEQFSLRVTVYWFFMYKISKHFVKIDAKKKSMYSLFVDAHQNQWLAKGPEAAQRKGSSDKLQGSD